MNYKIITGGGFMFITSLVIGLYTGIVMYPSKEFSRVVKENVKTVGGYWKFRHMDDFVTADFKTVVKPSVDFLYSSASLNADDAPYLLSIPPIDRYWVLQFMEDDTDAFAYVGSRLNGLNAPVKVLIIPKDYKGDTGGYQTIEMKSDICWLLARFLVYDKSDVEYVRNIQNQLSLEPIKG